MLNNTNIILSAQCDDATLSLGGLMLVEKNRFVVINFFATCAWSVNKKLKDPIVATKINNSEEKQVSKILNNQLYLFENPEALLRGHDKWNSRKNVSEDMKTKKAIQRSIKSLIGTGNNIYLPMAIGGHVDHRILSNSVIELFSKLSVKNKIFFYEDLPYAYYGGHSYKLKQIKNKFYIKKQIIDISKVINKKISILKIYKSQLDKDHLFKVKDFASKIVPSKFSERIWYVEKKK